MAQPKTSRGNHLPKTSGNGDNRGFASLATALANIGKGFYSRGWVFGTGGNFSAVLNHDPLRLAITPTSMDKGALVPTDILEINGAGEVLSGSSRPSFEYLLHLAIIHARKAGAVLHTHSIWATVLSERQVEQGGLAIEGYEMLKGLEGVKTHQHREWVPILHNSQDMVQLSAAVETVLNENPSAHGFLLHGHGLYTWGQTLEEAKRHVEILEFLFEVVGRTAFEPKPHTQRRMQEV
jgi:methylthioribulose-1-phosphate dehydratase